MNFSLAIVVDCFWVFFFFFLLVFQKDLLLSQAVVACLETLVEYLYMKNQDVGKVFMVFLLLVSLLQ